MSSANIIQRTVSFNNSTINLNTTINPGLPNSNGNYILELFNTMSENIVGNIIIENLNPTPVIVSVVTNVLSINDIKEYNYVRWNQVVPLEGEHVIPQLIFRPNSLILVMTNDNNIDVRLNAITE